MKMKFFRKWIRIKRVVDREEFVSVGKEADRIKRREKYNTLIRIDRDLEANLLGKKKLT